MKVKCDQLQTTGVDNVIILGNEWDDLKLPILGNPVTYLHGKCVFMLLFPINLIKLTANALVKSLSNEGYTFQSGGKTKWHSKGPYSKHIPVGWSLVIKFTSIPHNQTQSQTMELT